MSTLTRRVSTVVASCALVVLVGGATGRSASDVAPPASAQPIPSVPGTVSGELDATKLDSDAPVPGCVAAQGVEWYTLTAPRRAPMLARLVARDGLAAALVVYRLVGPRRTSLVCREAGRDGVAQAAWYGSTNGSFLVGVVRLEGSPAGRYDLEALIAERPELPPGTALPAAGGGSTVHAVLDPYDAWSVSLQRGATYRLNLRPLGKGGCVSYELYRPHVSSFGRARPVLARECGGYAVFTPGIDGGGVYSIVVRAVEDDLAEHAYRLETATAGPDDTAPGVTLENGEVVTGALTLRGIDTVDLYRFVVPRENVLTTLELLQKPGVGLRVGILDEAGKAVSGIAEGTGRQVLRLRLPSGRYYAALQTRDTGGSYTLQLRVRDVTTTTIASGGEQELEVPRETAVPLTVDVASASHGGRVVVEIDHFDPLFGWHFASSVSGAVTSAGVFTTVWTPPSVGLWRARARFVANPYSSFSQSGYVRMHVTEPLE